MNWMIVEIEDGLQRSLRGVLLRAKAVVLLVGGGVVDSDASPCFNDSFLDGRELLTPRVSRLIPYGSGWRTCRWKFEASPRRI